jgi:hypothetical protein
MSTGDDSRIDKLAREKMEGKSYSDIRQDLSDSGMGDEEIKRLIRQVDERVLSETVRQGTKDRTQQWYRLGLILAICGLVLSIAYNAGIILDSLPALLIYSPFFAGILVMVYARILQRKKTAPTDNCTGAIRRKRPYK